MSPNVEEGILSDSGGVQAHLRPVSEARFKRHPTPCLPSCRYTSVSDHFFEVEKYAPREDRAISHCEGWCDFLVRLSTSYRRAHLEPIEGDYNAQTLAHSQGRLHS